MTRNFFLIRCAVLLALALFSSAPQAHAGDQPVTFVATVTGIVCDGCKDHIRQSFTKLEAVTSVEIVAGAAPGTHAVTVTTTSAKLTKEQAIASLGEQASTYVVQTWEKK